jgi:chemotaxis protein histidine kinase CheA
MNDFAPFFLKESASMLKEWEDACLEIVAGPTAASLERLYRVAHTLKGAAAMAGIDEVSEQIHHAERLIEDLWNGKVRSTIGAVHTLMQLPPAIRCRLKEIKVAKVPPSSAVSSGCGNGTSVQQLLAVLKEVTMEEAQALGLPLEIQLEGDEFSLEPRMLEHLTVIVVHLLRNALVYGLNDPQNSGRRGLLRLKSTWNEDEITVEIADNGGGIDPEAIHRQAIKRGLLAADSRPSPGELLNLIFLPGFSLKDEATGLAGRGMGMAVVRQKAEELDGRVEVASMPGTGATFRIILPHPCREMIAG